MCDLLPVIKENANQHFNTHRRTNSTGNGNNYNRSRYSERIKRTGGLSTRHTELKIKQRDSLSLISGISWLKGPIRSRDLRGYLINNRGRDSCQRGAVLATGQGKWCRRMASYGVDNFRDFGRRPRVAQGGSESTRMPAE